MARQLSQKVDGQLTGSSCLAPRVMLTVQHNVEAWHFDNFVECIQLSDIWYQYDGNLCIGMCVANLSGFIFGPNSCDDFAISLDEKLNDMTCRCNEYGN
jgi:hypothetical protein